MNVPMYYYTFDDYSSFNFINVFSFQIIFRPAKKWYNEGDFPLGKDSPRVNRRIKLEELIV
jgi:hypothetical protein